MNIENLIYYEIIKELRDDNWDFFTSIQAVPKDLPILVDEILEGHTKQYERILLHRFLDNGKHMVYCFRRPSKPNI